MNAPCAIRDVLALGVLAVVAAASAIPACSRASARADASVDAASLGEIGRAFETWARDHDTTLPLPSALDAKNWTVTPLPGQTPQSKDTSSAAYSILIFTGHLTPEVLVSRAELNPSIRADDDYQMTEPRLARNPKRALWDPGFSVDFIGVDQPGAVGTGVGNASFAHLALTPERRDSWRISTGLRHPVLSHRGPEILAVKKNGDSSVSPTYANVRSNAFRAFTPGSSWSGSVLRADLSLEDWEDEYPLRGRIDGSRHPMYVDAQKAAWPDLIFLDEPDDPGRVNIFLGLFPRAGPRPGECRAIWD